MPLTKVQLQEYLAEDGRKCPVCKSEDIGALGDGQLYPSDDGLVEGYSTCFECGKRWVSVYSLTYAELQED